MSTTAYVVIEKLPASVAQLNMCLTGDQEVLGPIPAGSCSNTLS